MTKHSWSGGINENISIKIVACRGSMTEQPNGLIIDRKEISCSALFYSIDANEMFLVVLRVDGVDIARLPSHAIAEGSC